MRMIGSITILVLHCAVVGQAASENATLQNRFSANEISRMSALIAARRMANRHRPAARNGGTTADTCPDKCVCQFLNEVTCNEKSLKKIPPGIPSNVKKLNLEVNKISTIRRKDFFVFSANLLRLFLQNNRIKYLGNGNFMDFKVLQELRLSHNNIKELRKTSLRGMQKLQALYLDHNQISSIHPLAFRGLNKLRFLRLEGNKISRIHRDTFVTMDFENYFKFTSVESLHLEENNFSHLPRHVFDHVTEQTSVYLSQNPWDCSCQSKWLKRWMENSNQTRCEEIATGNLCPICNSPELLRDRPMEGISSESMKCSQFPIQDIDSLQSEEDAVLFSNSELSETQLSLSVYSNRLTILSASCKLAKKPITSVSENEKSDRSYHALFDGTFLCTAESLVSEPSAGILENYENRRTITLHARNERDVSHRESFRTYSVEVDDSSNTTGTITSVTIASEMDFLLNNETTISFLELAEANVSLRLTTSFAYNYNPKATKFSKRPWLLFRQPNPSVTEVEILETGKQLSMKCKVVGQPKPVVTWRLPSGYNIRSGQSSGRYLVKESGNLFVRSLTVDDSGIYRCTATARDPASGLVVADIASSKVEVVIPTKDDFSTADLSPETHQYTVQKGDSWMSVCQFELLQGPTIAWLTPDNRLLVGESSYRHGQVNTYSNGTISISNFKKSNQGLYRCIGSTAEGKMENSVFVSFVKTEEDILETMLIDLPDYDNSDDPLTPEITEDIFDFIETNVIPETEIDYETVQRPESTSRNETSAAKESSKQPPAHKYPESEITIEDNDVDGYEEDYPEEYYGVEITSLNSTTQNDKSGAETTKPLPDPTIRSPITNLTAKYRGFLNTPTSTARNTLDIESTYRTHILNHSLPDEFDDTTSPNIRSDLEPAPPYFEFDDTKEFLELTGEPDGTLQANESSPRPPYQNEDSSLSDEVNRATSKSEISRSRDLATESTAAAFNYEAQNTTASFDVVGNIASATAVSRVEITDIFVESRGESSASHNFTAKNFTTTVESVDFDDIGNVSKSDQTNLLVIPDIVDVAPDFDVQATASLGNSISATPSQQLFVTSSSPYEISDSLPTVTVTSSASNDFVMTDYVRFEIFEEPASKVTRRPVQRHSKHTVYGREYAKTILPCMPLDVGSSWTFTWTLPSGDIYSRPDRIVSHDWTKYVNRNGSLLVTRIKPDDKGNYTCVAADDNNNVEYYNIIELIVLEKLRIVNPANEYIQLKTGDTASIPCEATGSPQPVITWKTPWGVMATYRKFVEEMEVLWNGTLLIYNMNVDLRGAYKCYAQNGNDMQMRTVTLSMLRYPPRFSVSPSGMFKVKRGGTISLQCKAKGYPKPSIRWMLARGGSIRPNEAIFLGSRLIPKFRVRKDGSLLITRASSRETGLYHCVISNYLGRVASMTRLAVVNNG